MCTGFRNVDGKQTFIVTKVFSLTYIMSTSNLAVQAKGIN